MIEQFKTFIEKIHEAIKNMLEKNIIQRQKISACEYSREVLQNELNQAEIDIQTCRKELASVELAVQRKEAEVSAGEAALAQVQCL